MYGVAIGAYHTIQRVRRTADVGAGQRLRVATQAVVEYSAWLQFGKRNDGRLAAMGFDVRFTGTVTALTSGAVGRFFPGRDALEVGILVKAGPNVRMARSTYVTANKRRARLGCERCSGLLGQRGRP